MRITNFDSLPIPHSVGVTVILIEPSGRKVFRCSGDIWCKAVGRLGLLNGPGANRLPGSVVVLRGW